MNVHPAVAVGVAAGLACTGMVLGATTFAPSQARAAEVDPAWVAAQEAADQVEARELEARLALQEALAGKADQVARVLTREAKAAGAVRVDDYVSSLGRTERQVDQALAALFAGSHVVVDYVTATPAPIVTVYVEEDYKVTVNLSSSVAEVFTPIG